MRVKVIAFNKTNDVARNIRTIDDIIDEEHSEHIVLALSRAERLLGTIAEFPS